MTKLVLLSKIKDNAYRDKKRNPIDQGVVDQLVESIDATEEFWEGVYGREAGDYVEIAFGHTRVEAARKAGLKEIPITVRNLSDGDMIMRMARENVRGELPVMLEAVSAVVKALGENKISRGTGKNQMLEVDPKTRKDAVRYAPSFVAGKLSGPPDGPHAYTAATLARFLGGMYLKSTGKAQDSVQAALSFLELEEKRVPGFALSSLKKELNGEVHYKSAKDIISAATDLKQREVKVIERREKTAAEVAEFDRKQRELQAKRKEEEKAASEARAKLVADLAEAKREEDAKRAKEIKARLDAKEAAEAEKEVLFKLQQSALDQKVKARKEAEAIAKKEDEYLPVKREVERILRKLLGDTATTKEALSAEVKALARLPLNNTDRERLRQAALNYGTWFIEWVGQQLLPPLSTKSKLNEYRSREEAKRRAQEAKDEKAKEKGKNVKPKQ
jgi:hypothetical protein